MTSRDCQIMCPEHADPIGLGFVKESSKPRSTLIHHFSFNFHFIYWPRRFTSAVNHNVWGQWGQQMHSIYNHEQVLGNADKKKYLAIIYDFLTFLRLLSFQSHRTLTSKLSYALNNKLSPKNTMTHYCLEALIEHLLPKGFLFVNLKSVIHIAKNTHFVWRQD